MGEKKVQKPTMSSVEFTQDALRNHIAPPGIGSVKSRLRHAARRLGWEPSRTKDAWYARRISISADEIKQVEEVTGLRYGQRELRDNEHLIAQATALLDGTDPHIASAFLAGLVAFSRAVASTGTRGEKR